MYLKSLYLTFKAATYKPALKLATKARKRKIGRYRIFQPGTKPYHIIITAKIKNDIRKSIRFTMTVLTGIIRRGKYIFVSMVELPISDVLASLKDVEKNCQGSSAENTKIG